MANIRLIALCLTLFLGTSLITYIARQPDNPFREHLSILFSESEEYIPQEQLGPKYAFATFVAGFRGSDTFPDDSIPDETDGYFLGARVLTYQLLHAPESKTNKSIPFLVLVTEDVSERKKARLAKDGATVVPVEKIWSNWVTPKGGRWQDVLTKLRLFQLEEYDKICFIDADHLVTKRLDGVFEDPATTLQITGSDEKNIQDDEAPLPTSYGFASKPEAFGYDHPIPPADSNYLNIGFFVLRPSRVLLDYYLSLITPEKEGRFDPGFPEQNLLNYAHRRDGNMPWRQLWYGWNMNWPTVKDLDAGAASFHAKFWDTDPTHDPKLKEMWWAAKNRMDGYWRARAEMEEGK